MESPLKNRSGWPKFIPGLALFFVVAGVFSVALQNGFTILDDPDYVTENSMVQKGLTWPGVSYAFTANVASNWHPLTLLSHMADCQLFGLNPWGHHLTSVCLHAVNTVLVFLVLRRLTGAVWRSFFVALFFGLHPLHVESVAWVAERKDVLSTGFALLTLLAYAGFAIENRRRDYWIALGLFACGLMCKSMLVTLPCILLLVDFWPLNRWKKDALAGLIREKIPFFLLSAGACLIALATQKQAAISLSWLPLPLRMENSCVACVRYLGKLFYPADLCAYYPLPAGWPAATIALSASLLVVVSVVVVVLLRRRPYLFMGWFWFLGTLVPVIGLVQVGMQAMADRYTYLPALGIFISLVWLVTEAAQSLRLPKAVLPAAALSLSLVYSILTQRQISYWHDSETLLRHAIAVTQHNGVAHFLLAREFNRQRRPDAAIAELQAAIRAEPDVPRLHSELAIKLEAARRTDESILEYTEAWRLDPKSAEAGNNLGMALSRLGRYGDAIQVFQITVQSSPEVEEVHLNFGNALAHGGKPADAVTQFKLALALKPDDVDARNNLGVMLFQMRQIDEAMEQFQAVLKLDPQNVEARRNLDAILKMKNRTP